MRARIILFVISAGVFLASTALALKLDRAQRLSQQALNENSLEVARAEQMLRSTEIRLTEAAAARTHTQRALETLRAKATAAASATVPRKEAAAPLMGSVRTALSNDPKLQNLQLAAQRGNLLVYAPLFRRLGLPTAKLEQAETLFARRMEKNTDLAAAAQAHHALESRASFGKIVLLPITSSG